MNSIKHLVGIYTNTQCLHIVYPLFVVGLIFGNQPAIPSDPVGDVNRFITQFEDEYGTEHPEYLSCSYSDVCL